MMGTWGKVGRFWILFITRVTASILFQLKDCSRGCIEGRNKIRVSRNFEFKSWGERGENDEQSTSMNHVVSSHPSYWPVSESKSRWCKMPNDIETKTQDTQNNKKSKAFHYAPSPSYICNIHRPPPTAYAAPDSLVPYKQGRTITWLTKVLHHYLHVKGVGARTSVHQLHFSPNSLKCSGIPR